MCRSEARLALLVFVLGGACGGSGPDTPDGGPDTPDGGPDTPDAAGCPGVAPGSQVVLSVDDPSGNEDPAVVRAADGTILVAFFSRRDGNADLYVTTSADDGTTWTAPARVTTDLDDDLAPSFVQDDDGTFLLSWFRMQVAFPYAAHIVAARSADGVTWDPAGERPVTPVGSANDWVPALARAPGGPLVIYFASNQRDVAGWHIYRTTSADGDTWTAPVYVDELNLAGSADHLPFVLRGPAGLAIAWERYDNPDAFPWEDNTSNVFYATSTDGLAWSGAVDVTHDATTFDGFPDLYRDATGATHLVWVTTAVTPASSVVDLAVADIPGYPGGREDLSVITGYSPRVIATCAPDVRFGVWVQAASGQLDVYARRF